MKKHKRLSQVASHSLSYRAALERLASLSRFGSKPGLQRMNRLLAALGQPQRNFKCILVAGTNGKGSTSAMLAKILFADGRKTGSYFSPSIFSFRERIQINGKWISKKDFCSCAREVFSLLPSMRSDSPTFFEAMTAMALLCFARAGVQYAVLEAGLGGRLDATNACEPALSVITSIGLEHTGVLGKTTRKIAREKAGILRPKKPLVCAVQNRPARNEIRKIARRLGAPFHFAGEGHVRAAAAFLPRGSPSFQRANAACAIKAAELLGVKKPAVRSALHSFRMPARWQKISNSPSLIMDCCHNPPAAMQIRADLRRDFSARPSLGVSSPPRVLLFSAMGDKEYAAVLALLAPHFDFIVVCRPPYARAAKLPDLEKAAKKAFAKAGRAPVQAPKRLALKKNPGRVFAVSGPDAAFSFAKKLSSSNGRVLVCGSIYLLQYLFGEREFRITG